MVGTVAPLIEYMTSWTIGFHSPALTKSSMAIYAYNPSIQDSKIGEPGIQGHPWHIARLRPS